MHVSMCAFTYVCMYIYVCMYDIHSEIKISSFTKTSTLTNNHTKKHILLTHKVRNESSRSELFPCTKTHADSTPPKKRYRSQRMSRKRQFKHPFKYIHTHIHTYIHACAPALISPHDSCAVSSICDSLRGDDSGVPLVRSKAPLDGVSFFFCAKEGMYMFVSIRSLFVYSARMRIQKFKLLSSMFESFF
jgi:hypothetical protein